MARKTRPAGLAAAAVAALVAVACGEAAAGGDARGAGEGLQRVAFGRHAPGAAAFAATEGCSAEGLTKSGTEAWLSCAAVKTQQPLPSGEFLKKNSELALAARKEVPAAQKVPEKLFLRDVLPYRHLDEPVEPWREGFYAKLRGHAEGKKSVREAAEAVTVAAWTELGRNLKFEANLTPAVMSPGQVLHHGSASCTGMSIFAADALRSVGIPARVVGTAEWNREDGGNHNWVEAWTGEGEDGWHFFDAVPAKKVDWDRGWFLDGTAQKAVAGGLHGIYSAVWDKSEADAHFNITWRTPFRLVPALDRTAFYRALPVER